MVKASFVLKGGLAGFCAAILIFGSSFGSAEAGPAPADKIIGDKTPAPASKKNQPAATKPEAGKDKTTKTGKKKLRRAYSRSGICKDLDRLADKYGLPPLFFARLIWQESRFNPYAVSPKGAEGIAQFMPGTAAIWGLDDPFDPGQALLKSAQYLSWLHRKHGNLGLAAAGYNAGSQRVEGWLAGTDNMPHETRNYVYAITGFSIDEWAAGKAEFVGVKLNEKLSASACDQLSVALKNDRGIVNASLQTLDNKGAKRLPPPPWGVQLAGSFSRAVAMRHYRSFSRKFGKIIGANRIVMKSSRQGGRGRRIFHRVRVGANSRQEANKLCSRLKAAGAACVVLKN